MDFQKRLKKLKLLIFDVDGILTDNTVLMGENGREYKRFNLADGMGFYLARLAGIKIALISGRYSPATDSRAKELGLGDVYQGYLNKVKAIEELTAKYDLSPEEICYMGDDIIDLQAMETSGFCATVPHGAEEIRSIADYITEKEGGNGAARELINLILKAKGIKATELWGANNA